MVVTRRLVVCIFVLLLVILLFNVALKLRAKVLSRVPKHRKAARCLTEKTGVKLDELRSGTSYGAVGVSSVLVTQHDILNKVSLHRNTHKTRLCADRLMKML